MQQKRDCYEVLGVSRDASQDQIKKAYRQRALQFHPDRNPDDKESEEKFKEATDAYSVIGESQNRQQYDQFGWAAFQQGGGAGFHGFTGAFEGFEDIFGDLFSAFFGGMGGMRQRGRAGRDLRLDLEIEFEEAVFGTEKEVEIGRRVSCETCGGSGSEPGQDRERCSQCGGAGQLRVQQGFFTISRTCHVCGGVGEKITHPCGDCGGSGRRNLKSKLKVNVPAGIDHGQRLRLSGEGEAGEAGGPPGDLYVVMSVREHPIFERDGDDIVCDVPVSYTTTVLGSEIGVPTLEGETQLKIPPGTASGKIFRLRNRGVQIIGTTRRGDQRVRVYIEVPKRISAEHRQLLESLREKEKEDQVGESKGLFDKVRDIFV